MDEEMKEIIRESRQRCKEALTPVSDCVSCEGCGLVWNGKITSICECILDKVAKV